MITKHTVSELKEKYPEQVFISEKYVNSWPSDDISNSTYKRCIVALEAGKKIRIGNVPYPKSGILISVTRWKIPGFPPRTIRVTG